MSNLECPGVRNLAAIRSEFCQQAMCEDIECGNCIFAYQNHDEFVDFMTNAGIEEKDLKRCPFCGEDTAEIHSSDEEPVMYNVFCPTCCIRGPEFKALSDAIDHWNRRS